MKCTDFNIYRGTIMGDLSLSFGEIGKIFLFFYFASLKLNWILLNYRNQ